MAGIYIHVPFCASKCAYCDFASFPKEVGKQEVYFGCLFKEMRSRFAALKGMTFDTVYFGGGTPSFVDAKYILGAMRVIKSCARLTDNAEVTLEVNPGTIDRNKLRIYKQAGITRFSIGLQSSDDRLLKRVGRIHDREDFIKACDILKGFELSADVMTGLYDQTEKSVFDTIDCAIAGGVKHISVYALQAEVGTPIYTDYLNGLLPSDDEVADVYEKVVSYLAEKGFRRYEVSNFAVEGHESRHNMNYWKRGEYIGFGVAASSFIAGRRFTNAFTIDEYVHALLRDKYAEVSSETVEGDDAKFEFLMLALRTADGVSLKRYRSAFGSDFTADFADAIKSRGNYLDVTADRVKIKDEYLYVQNDVIMAFMK
ncbi:MAG: radical SAM family heme chaperone HemW [Clostridia bacterium]|nr:radical SAM family heme chaperone HemW [Clostridia bacterium]